MKAHLLSAAALVAVFASSQVASATPPSSSVTPRMLEESLGSYASVELNSALESALDAHMAGLNGPTSQINGAVLEVARFGKVVYSDKVGALHGGDSSAILAAGLNPTDGISTDTIFDLQSMTKVVTAALIVRLSELGHLSLDDTVSTYIPEMCQSHVYNATFDGWELDGNGDPILVSDPVKCNDVKVRDLVAYRAGFGIDTEYWDPVYGSADPWATMAHTPLTYAPGTTQMYSDMSYRLLGHVAEVAMLEPLHALVRQYITMPFGMDDSDFEPAVYMSGSTVSYPTGAGTSSVLTEDKLARVAGTGPSSGGVRSYAWAELQDDNDHWTQRHNVIHKDKNGNVVNLTIGTATAPSGTGCDGLFSTARDFMKFAQVFLNMGKAVSPVPSGVVCVRAPCVEVTQVLTSADVSMMTAVPAPTTTFQPLIPSAAYPTGPNYTENLVHGHKAYGWELPDGGAYSPSGQHAISNVVTKTGGAGTYVKIDFDNDTIAVLMTNHGLPTFNYYATLINEVPGYMIHWPAFDAMLAEAGPAAVNDLVSTNIDCTSCY